MTTGLLESPPVAAIALPTPPAELASLQTAVGNYEVIRVHFEDRADEDIPPSDNYYSALVAIVLAFADGIGAMPTKLLFAVASACDLTRWLTRWADGKLGERVMPDGGCLVPIEEIKRQLALAMETAAKPRRMETLAELIAQGVGDEQCVKMCGFTINQVFDFRRKPGSEVPPIPEDTAKYPKMLALDAEEHASASDLTDRIPELMAAAKLLRYAIKHRD